MDNTLTAQTIREANFILTVAKVRVEVCDQVYRCLTICDRCKVVRVWEDGMVGFLV